MVVACVVGPEDVVDQVQKLTAKAVEATSRPLCHGDFVVNKDVDVMHGSGDARGTMPVLAMLRR